MEPLDISEVLRADLDSIHAIEVAQFDDPWSTRVLRDELEAPNRRYTKAARGGAVVGYLGLMLVDAEAHVNTIATAPTAEGTGVATALLAEATSGSNGNGSVDALAGAAILGGDMRRLLRAHPERAAIHAHPVVLF